MTWTICHYPLQQNKVMKVDGSIRHRFGWLSSVCPLVSRSYTRYIELTCKTDGRADGRESTLNATVR